MFHELNYFLYINIINLSKMTDTSKKSRKKNFSLDEERDNIKIYIKLQYPMIQYIVCLLLNIFQKKMLSL